MDNKRRRNISLVVLVLFLLLIGDAIWALTHAVPSVQLHYVTDLYSSTGTFARYNDKLLVVDSGQLVVNDFTTSKMATLDIPQANPGIINPDTLQTSNDNSYILFHTNIVDQNTTLASILSARNLNPTLDYWWIFNVASKTYTPLPNGILLAKFNGNRVIALSSKTPGEVITDYTPNGIAIHSLPITNASDFYPAPGGYVLQLTNGKLLFTRDGIVSKQIGESSTLVGVTNDNKYLITINGTDNKQVLQQISLSDFSAKTIAKGLSGRAIWLPSGLVLYQTMNGSLKTYNTTTHKTVAWNISNHLSLQPVLLVNSHSVVLSDSNKKYYLYSD